MRTIKAKRLQECSVRDLHSLVEGQVRFHDVDGVQAALVTLVNAGYARPVEVPRTGVPGRPPSPRYAVSPYVVEP